MSGTASTAYTGNGKWRYERRSPEQALLYRLVAEHYPRFLCRPIPYRSAKTTPASAFHPQPLAVILIIRLDRHAGGLADRQLIVGQIAVLAVVRRRLALGLRALQRGDRLGVLQIALERGHVLFAQVPCPLFLRLEQAAVEQRRGDQLVDVVVGHALAQLVDLALQLLDDTDRRVLRRVGLA